MRPKNESVILMLVIIVLMLYSPATALAQSTKEFVIDGIGTIAIPFDMSVAVDMANTIPEYQFIVADGKIWRGARIIFYDVTDMGPGIFKNPDLMQNQLSSIFDALSGQPLEERPYKVTKNKDSTVGNIRRTYATDGMAVVANMYYVQLSNHSIILIGASYADSDSPYWEEFIQNIIANIKPSPTETPGNMV